MLAGPPSCSGDTASNVSNITYSNVVSYNTFRMRAASDTHSFRKICIQKRFNTEKAVQETCDLKVHPPRALWELIGPLLLKRRTTKGLIGILK